MKSLMQPNGEFLLEQSLEDLHAASTNWLSELEFWEVELAFFQKLLDNHSQKFKTADEKKKMSHFQNLIIYYGGEIIDQLKQQIRRHEKQLAVELALKNKLNEIDYRKNHVEISEEIRSFKAEYMIHKREFFEFIEKIL